jgi:hypothetical protein
VISLPLKGEQAYTGTLSADSMHGSMSCALNCWIRIINARQAAMPRWLQLLQQQHSSLLLLCLLSRAAAGTREHEAKKMAEGRF